jgi:hypothetical protein
MPARCSRSSWRSRTLLVTQTSLHTRFPDEAVGAVVGADRTHEWPVAVVALGDGVPALAARGDAVVGEVDAAPMEFPLVTDAQRAGDLGVLGQAWDRGAPVDVPVDGRDPIETVVLARGSQKLMDPNRGLPERTMRTSNAGRDAWDPDTALRRRPRRRRIRARRLTGGRT